MNQPLADMLSRRRYDAVIVRVYVDGVSQSSAVRAKAGDVTYDAYAVSEQGQATVTTIKPYNRPYDNASIITARVGDDCEIVVNLATGESRLYVYTEKEDLRDCDGNPIEELPT